MNNLPSALHFFATSTAHASPAAITVRKEVNSSAGSTASAVGGKVTVETLCSWSTRNNSAPGRSDVDCSKTRAAPAAQVENSSDAEASKLRDANWRTRLVGLRWKA